jgi:hypothetical protein
MATRKSKSVTVKTVAVTAAPAKKGRQVVQSALPGLASAVAQPSPQYVSGAPAALAAPIHPLPTLPLPTEAPSRRPLKQTAVRQRFGELRTALTEGWEIVEPIFARPLWSASDDSTTAFNFVLRREGVTRLLTVPEGRTVQRFVRDRQFVVDYRR